MDHECVQTEKINDLKINYKEIHDHIYVGDDCLERRIVTTSDGIQSIKSLVKNIMVFIAILVTIETGLIGGIYYELSGHIKSENKITISSQLGVLENVANAKEPLKHDISIKKDINKSEHKDRR